MTSFIAFARVQAGNRKVVSALTAMTAAVAIGVPAAMPQNDSAACTYQNETSVRSTICPQNRGMNRAWTAAAAGAVFVLSAGVALREMLKGSSPTPPAA